MSYSNNRDAYIESFNRIVKEEYTDNYYLENEPPRIMKIKTLVLTYLTQNYEKYIKYIFILIKKGLVLRPFY